MKILTIMAALIFLSTAALVTGCASDAHDMSGPAGAGTSGTVQGQGGPGNGPDGGMNGTH